MSRNSLSIVPRLRPNNRSLEWTSVSWPRYAACIFSAPRGQLAAAAQLERYDCFGAKWKSAMGTDPPFGRCLSGPAFGLKRRPTVFTENSVCPPSAGYQRPPIRHNKSPTMRPNVAVRLPGPPGGARERERGQGEE
jgi:hypothetical protein